MQIFCKWIWKLQNAIWACGPVTFGSYRCIVTDQTRKMVLVRIFEGRNLGHQSVLPKPEITWPHVSPVGVCRFSGSFARHSVHTYKWQWIHTVHVSINVKLQIQRALFHSSAFSLGHFLSLCDPVSSSALSCGHVPEDRAARGDTQSYSNQQQNTQSF